MYIDMHIDMYGAGAADLHRDVRLLSSTLTGGAHD
jgi:hypothetical protein